MKSQLIHFSKILLVLISLVLLVVAGVNAYEVWVKEEPVMTDVSSANPVTNPIPPVLIGQKKALVLSNFTKNIWRPRTLDKKIDLILEPIRDKWGLKLSGTIVVPGEPSVAFIIDKTGSEGFYSEGDSIDHWKIKKIENELVILVDAAGREMILKSGVGGSTDTPPVTRTPPLVGSVEQPPPSITPPPRVSRSELINRVKPLIDTLPAETIFQGIEDITGISRDEISPDTNLSEYVTKLLEVSQDGILREDDSVGVATVTFGLEVNPDNSVKSPANSFLVSDNRIYASFSGQGNLKGLKKVVTRWTNISTGGSIVYIGNKPINPSSPCNYVWVEKKNGWTVGLYQVELFKPGTLIKVAKGRFQIK
ncbi:hypothetical protein ACFL5I_01250 [Planctomycetota bacterium]